jgi:hypothetical protein
MGAKQTKNSSYSLKQNNSLKRNKTFSSDDGSLKQQQKRKSTLSLSTYNYFNHSVNDNDLKNINNNSSTCTTSPTTTTASSSSVSNKLSNNNNNNNDYAVVEKQQQQNRQVVKINENYNNNINKSAFKRFGISPRFKRKIVEAITKTNHNAQQQNMQRANNITVS